MKNSSKNTSGKNGKQYKKNSNSYSKNTNSSKKNNRYLINSSKNNSFENQNESNKNNFSLKRRNLRTKTTFEHINKAQESYPEILNKKNFDDWIWGKHSVFEAFENERAINRIWCTSEIFSSEKFYISL